MSKLLNDVKAAGFDIDGLTINVDITENLAKFASLQTDKNPSSWDCYDIDITNLETDIKQFCLDNARLAPLFIMLHKALQIPDGYKLVPIEFNINVKALLFNQKYGSPSCQKRVVKVCICNGCVTDRLEAMLDVSPPTNTKDI